MQAQPVQKENEGLWVQPAQRAQKENEVQRAQEENEGRQVQQDCKELQELQVQ